MNEELYFLYRDLSKTQKSYIAELFNNSPKLLRLIDVIRDKERDFTTLYAVRYIYEEEFKETDFQVLTNRFYKLRKELKDWLLAQLKDSPVCFTEEERELTYLRQLVISNEYAFALPHLEKLEKRCWELNLFELLPLLQELLLRCVQSTRRVDAKKQEEMLEKYELAHRLFMVLSKVKAVGFKSLNTGELKDTIEYVRNIIKPYSAYPRFKMLYHYIAFSRGSNNPTMKGQILVRHLNQYKKLREEYPDIPVTFYQRHYKEKNRLYFSIFESIFRANRNEHKKALELIKDKEAYQEGLDMYFGTNGPTLVNYFLISLYAQDYDFAWTRLEALIAYKTDNELEPAQDYPNECDYLDFYSQAYPHYDLPENIDRLLKVSIAYQKKIKHSRYIALRSVVHFQIYVIQKKWGLARRELDNKHCEALFEQHKAQIDFGAMFDKTLNLLVEKDKKGMVEFVQEIKQQKKDLKLKLSPTVWSFLSWTEQMLKHAVR